MEKLHFLSTFTVDEFKSLQGITSIDILQSDKTGKCFFAFGSKSGAVTNRYPSEPLKVPMVSEVNSEETGETFYLLHNKGDYQATLRQTL